MNEKKKPHILPALIVFIIMAMISGIYALVFLMQHTPDKNRIIEGVYVYGINISGMTAEEAQAAIEQYTNGKSARTLTVDVNGKKVQTTLEELEFHAEENDTVEKAMSLGKTGSFLENYREVNRIKEEHVNYTLSYTYSEKKVKKFVKKK